MVYFNCKKEILFYRNKTVSCFNDSINMHFKYLHLNNLIIICYISSVFKNIK